MRLTYTLATLLASLACSSVRPPTSGIMAPKPAIVSVREQWKPFGIPSLGVRMDFPAPPEVWERTSNSEESGSTHTEGASCTVDGTIFSFFRISRWGRARVPDADVLESWRKGSGGDARSRLFTWEGFSGIEVRGKSKTGGNVLTRAHVVGDGLLVTTVEAAKGQLDASRAERFLSSLAFEVPWSMRAFPNGGFSIAAPQGAIEGPLQNVQVPNVLVSYMFRVGGKDERSYSVLAAETTAEVTAPDAVFDSIIQSLAKSGIEVIWRGPAQSDAGPAHDVLGKAEHERVRVRYVLGNGRYFALIAEAATQEVLLQPEVTRFLDSLSVY